MILWDHSGNAFENETVLVKFGTVILRIKQLIIEGKERTQNLLTSTFILKAFRFFSDFNAGLEKQPG